MKKIIFITFCTLLNFVSVLTVPTSLTNSGFGLFSSPVADTTPANPVNFVRSRRQSDDDDSNLDITTPPSKLSPTEKPANITILSLDKSKATFVDALVKCMGPTKYCSLTSIRRHICILSCIMDPFPTIRNLLNIFEPIVKSLCRPMGTLFDTGLGYMHDYNEDLQQFPKFSITPFPEDSIIYGMDSLTFQIIKYGRNPITDILKPVVGTLTTTIQASGIPPSAGIPDLINPKCIGTDLLMGTQMLADVFISRSFAVDLTLPGWFVSMNLFPLNMGPLEASIQAIRLMSTFFAGVDCDLIGYSETGSATDCKFVVGKVKPLPKPVKLEQELLCGTLPDLPSVDLAKILPDVFPSGNGGSVNAV